MYKVDAYFVDQDGNDVKVRETWHATWAAADLDSKTVDKLPGASSETAAIPNYEGITAEADIKRWLPDASAVELARQKLATLPDGYLVTIPMVQPGKELGVWTLGQEVETVHGLLFWGLNAAHVPDGEPSYSEARNRAVNAALVALGSRKGTVAWASVTDDSVAVFEY